ncbi:MAG: cob(I)yrinic acid a,c-diamide adenosyltransferase [Polyangiaceae bacterium]|nr:cob(I)yrinic acid a,c-diamide adenosyltransferase [Polyangiaceae bacterium]MCW5789538.1 cob(I)yrinic acid a,c-diamide adenosyltransferase [Polyangiaceae bacterium]
MKIYTRTGDDGTTGLYGGDRVQKTDRRVEAYGTVDELNSVLGLARALDLGALDGAIERVQAELFVLGSELACAPGKEHKLRLKLVGASHIARLEAEIDEHQATLPPLKTFILPGGTAAAAALHQARSVSRRAERRTLEASREAPVRPELLRYLNRLSDWLFVLARAANHEAGREDIPWLPKAPTEATPGEAHAGEAS